MPCPHTALTNSEVQGDKASNDVSDNKESNSNENDTTGNKSTDVRKVIILQYSAY